MRASSKAQARIRKTTTAICAAAMVASMLPCAAFAEPSEATAATQEETAQLAATGDIASGTSGTCTWVVDSEGTLTVSPTTGSSGELGTWTGRYEAPWYSYRTQITSVKFSKKVKAQTCFGLFYGCTSLKSLDLSGLDTSSVTDMGDMFRYCSSLTSLDLAGLDTSNVTDMSYMFDHSALASLDLSDLDTSNVANMNYMFNHCSLTSLDLSDLDTSSATNMAGMFYCCAALTSLDLSGLDTSSVTDMGGMFYNCASLVTIDVDSNWSTKAVTSSSSMFTGCTSLVGGKGTAYDSTHTDATYARIDEGPDSDAPGYLTGNAALTLKASCAPADKGEKATVTTTLTGADSATYRFYYSADGGATWKQAAKNATGTVQVTATPTNSARPWKVVATDADGQTAEATFEVAINDPVAVTSTVPAAKYNAKATANVSVSHYGTYGPAKYKYYYSADNGVTWKQVAYHNKQYTDTDSLQVTANGTNAKRLWKVVVTFKDGRTAEAPFTVSYA